MEEQVERQRRGFLFTPITHSACIRKVGLYGSAWDLFTKAKKRDITDSKIRNGYPKKSHPTDGVNWASEPWNGLLLLAWAVGGGTELALSSPGSKPRALPEACQEQWTFQTQPVTHKSSAASPACMLWQSHILVALV